MDLLSIVREKGKSFVGTDSFPGIEAVIHHIEVAEKHFNMGPSSEFLYTDVIYRANQAFEGALKEAFRVLARKNPVGKSPSEIEKYLESEKLLKDRVLAQFRNYRTEWRNKSTHDYQLFFSSQEALLAIVSISAFFSILLDQMLQKHSHDLEQQKLQRRSYSLIHEVPNYNDLDFLNQSVELLKHFSADLRDDVNSRTTALTDYEILGRLSGFITQSDPEIEVVLDKLIKTRNQRLRPDVILTKRDKSIVVELTRFSSERMRRVREGIMKLRSYLDALGLTEGVVFIPALGNETLEVQEKEFEVNGKLIRAVLVVPRSKS